jgi:hypothetical protein
VFNCSNTVRFDTISKLQFCYSRLSVSYLKQHLFRSLRSTTYGAEKLKCKYFCHKNWRWANCGQYSDFLMHDITVYNNNLSSAPLILKITHLHLNRFTIKIFFKRAECTQRLVTRPTFMNQRSFSRLFCVCIDKQNI